MSPRDDGGDLVRGGQGRDAEEIAEAAVVIAAAVVAALALGAVAAVIGYAVAS